MAYDRIPKWLKVVSILALIWNLFGVTAYFMQVSLTPEEMAETEAQLKFYESYPTWVTSAYAIAVWSGLAASIGLVMKKSWAYYLFVLSLLGVVVQDAYSFLMKDALGIFGYDIIYLPVGVLIISLYLVILTRSAKEKGWLK
ncbi:MAG TPA: hypothetical protein ACFCUD_14135 [Cyclobacteriaceae bacterium]